MFKKTLIILALLSFGISVPMVLAQHGHAPHAEKVGHAPHAPHADHSLHGEHATHGGHNGIHLPSDEQLKEWGADQKMIDELHGLERKYEDESIDLNAALERAELDLERLHEDRNVSEASLHSAIDRYFAAKADLLKLHATAAVEARETMGEELFEKIRDAH